MARLLDQILILDIESTCWEKQPPPHEQSEIIEIGLCMLDLHTLERSGKRSILVRPTVSRVSPFCTELTTLTQADVDKGIPFERACDILRDEYASRDRAWASFGDYDRRQFERQCRDRRIPYPFGNTHHNIKSLCAILMGQRREIGMAGILDELRIPLEGTHHRGHDDAWNIAAIFAALLRRFREAA